MAAPSARSRVSKKHRTEVTEATEGELEKGKWAGDMAAPSARSRVSKKHRTEVTEATEGELEKGKWAGDMAAPSARSRVSKKHRTEVTEATEVFRRTPCLRRSTNVLSSLGSRRGTARGGDSLSG
jgi:hypothetical protein